MRVRARRWLEVLKEPHPSDWTKFAIYWLIFNAYLNEHADEGRNTEREKMNWFMDDNEENIEPTRMKNAARNAWSLPQLEKYHNRLVQYSPIYNMGPRGPRHYELANTDDPGATLNFIYGIRCNLLHGDKNPDDERDRGLVCHAGHLLHGMIGQWLNDEPHNYRT